MRAMSTTNITQHVTALFKTFAKPSRRFNHIHIDIITMSISERNKYCLTCIDRFTRWPETFPLEDQEAETVARTFYEGRICRFGTTLRVMTNQGRQFESHPFCHLSELKQLI